MRQVAHVFPALHQAVKETHNQVSKECGVAMFYCHDLNHAERVGNVAMDIAEDEQTARLAGAAGLCHNADRILQRLHRLGRDGQPPSGEIEKLVRRWLGADSFSLEESTVIVKAVLGHSAKNSPEDHPVLVALMDADRIVNTDADCIIRNGIYFGDDLPVVDPVHFLSNPTASWRNPKSNIRALHERENWFELNGPVGVRLPRALALMEPRLRFYRLFFETVRRQLIEEGSLR